MQEMYERRVQSPGQEDPLEKGIATYSSILAWRNPMDRGAWQVTKSWTQLKRLSTEIPSSSIHVVQNGRISFFVSHDGIIAMSKL